MGSWLWKPSLSRRIALTLVLSLIAIQLQAVVQIGWLSRPEFRFIGTRWLAERTNTLVREVFAVTPDKRHALLGSRAKELSFKLDWSTAPPREETRPAGVTQLRATLEDVLGTEARAVRIFGATINYRFPINRIDVTIDPAQFNRPVSVRPVGADEPDIAIPAGMRIAIQGRDGTWLSIEPIGVTDAAIGATLPWTPFIGGGLIIALVSTLTARRLVAPLDRLVVAAERIGTAREPVKVDTKGLHEFAAVAQAFETMQQRLLRFVDDRTQMLAAISHDLRSALTRLQLAAEQSADAPARAALTAEIDEMQSMVEATLAFATGEARLAPNQPTDIASLLISLTDEASDAGHRCQYRGPDHIESTAHPVSLKRAFRNLIDNAIKYGKQADVSLAVEAIQLTVTIEDIGPGIPPDSQEEVFTPFRRLDPARGHAIPGTGLGLTIARDVVQSHGGTITLANRPDGGLCVTVVLPLR
jgi:signal transduction histidine kinase